MSIVDPQSLAATVDAVNEAAFFGRRLAKSDRDGAARWIAARQGLPGSYAGMFAPTQKDFRGGIRLFTGEPVQTRAGIAHVLGEESCRALVLLKATGKGVGAALERAGAEMIRRLACGRSRTTGTYCCGKCTAALWRNLVAGGFGNREALLAAGLRTLKAGQTGDGAWGRFPFFYTLSALVEIATPAAVAQMRYAAPNLERLLRRRPAGKTFNTRRRALAERVLAAC